MSALPRPRRIPSVREALGMVRFEAPAGLPLSARSLDARAARANDIDELRRLAARRAPRPIFDFVDGGAGNESVVRRNRAEFDAVELVPRVLRDVESIELKTRFAGTDASAPIVVAPIGLARAVHPLGEIGLARAAARHGVPTVLSTMTSTTPEDLARHAPGAEKWLQLYLWRDRESSKRIVRRAADAGFTTLVLTLDVPVAGERLRDARHGLTFPPSVPLRTAARIAAKPAWAWRALTHEPIRYALMAATATRTGFVEQTNRTLDPSVTFDDLAWLREMWPGPILVKGVLSPVDAVRLVEAGVDGIVVSNHGGRQLEQAIATAHALPSIRAAVGRDALVFVDGGIRTGANIAAAIALGADAVFVGRPPVYGLMAGGQAGADRALEVLRSGLERTMALLGASSIGDIEPGMVAGHDTTARSSPSASTPPSPSPAVTPPAPELAPSYEGTTQ